MVDEGEQLTKLRDLVDAMEREIVESSELGESIRLLEAAMPDDTTDCPGQVKAIDLLRNEALMTSRKAEEYLLADEAYRTAWKRYYPFGVVLGDGRRISMR